MSFHSSDEALNTMGGPATTGVQGTRRSRRGAAQALLASTSLVALLLGAPLPAKAGGISVNNNVPNTSSVSNPANTTVTSIVVNASTLSGAISNAGTVTPGVRTNVVRSVTAAISVTNSTIGQGIVNSGTIATTNSALGAGIFVGLSKISSGGIANTNAITVTSTGNADAAGLFVSGSNVAGGTQAAITNSGTITATAAATLAVGIDVAGSTITGDIVNNSAISTSGTRAFSVGVLVSTVTGSITNGGSISATATQGANTGILIQESTVSAPPTMPSKAM